MNLLRPNQRRAIDNSIENDFVSGIHYHATGSGKSWIAMHIILAFHEKYPRSNIMWICEKKSILIEQFDITNLRKRGFDSIFQKFNILNYSDFKLGDWYNSVNSSIFWNKPVLLIMNRAFLTSSNKYTKIKIPFHLVIHDECHTIINKTTREFYDSVLQKCPAIKCIGFSATPNLTYEPYKNILTSYSIYDAFTDGVIVPPKIKWLSCDDMLNYEDLVYFIKREMDGAALPFKKIIVWCGMIELCELMATLWSSHFQDYKICMDTSKTSDRHFTYSDFDQFEQKAILFCAAKHREGSDIKNLDCCVFLDKVENRCPKVFLQCIGRVLRKDKHDKKTFGLVLDIRAKNSLAICNRLNSYLNLPSDIFPWTYQYVVHVHGEKLVKMNELQMIQHESEKKDTCTVDKALNPETIDELKALFVRQIPNKPVYVKRLEYELDMLYRKNLISHLSQAIQILNLTKNIPHVTRGSCGSSLVCYLLGISHIDPVKNNIKFARFLTEYRSNLPDIDLDFPHNLRDEVFLKIALTWPGKVARISNHVYFHDKSALRQAIRNAGIRKFIGKHDIDNELNKLSKDTQRAIQKDKESLENTFRCYSLHCGGIVYYPEGIPEELILDRGPMNGSSLQQIVMNKHDVSKEQNFKIDILSSRALSQCYEINKYKLIPFEEFAYDKLTFDMLHRGDNIGIILGESPLIRIAFMKIKPTTLHELAVCLSIIRPAAADAKSSMEDCDFDDKIIFDDDAIDLIGNYFDINDEEADNYRRAFAKGDKKQIEDLKKKMLHLPDDARKEIMKRLSNLSRYGFCKAHAFSYAQLIWKLAYMKAHNPMEFWKATLNNCQSSYRKWVHYYEAKLAGLDSTKKMLKRDDVSIYACNRRKKITNFTPFQQMQKYGYWMMETDNFFPGCYVSVETAKKDDGDGETLYRFNGIIASSKVLKNKKLKKLRLFIGVEKHRYLQINIENIRFFDIKKIGIEGVGKALTKQDEDCDIITALSYRFY